MQINKIGLNQGNILAQEQKNNTFGLDPKGAERLKKIVIVDEVDISKIGKDLLEESKKNDWFNPEDVKEMDNNYDAFKPKSSEEYIDQLFIEDVLAYKEAYKALEGSPDQSIKLQALNNTYLEKLDVGIERIADTLDQYFDKGRFFYELYSKEPLEDLFDKDVFKEALKKSILEVRDSVLTTDDADTESVQTKVLNSQQSEGLEHLSVNDLKELYAFAKEPPAFDDSIDQYDGDNIKKIADKEKALNHRIGQMNLPDYVKKSMYEVNRRMSEGTLRHVSYKQEEENNIHAMHEYNRLLKHLAAMLKQLGIRIEELEDTFGINPENKLLLKNLERRDELSSQYNDIKAQRDKEALEFADLEKNKHKITGTETYKRAKAVYKAEMEKEYEEE